MMCHTVSISGGGGGGGGGMAVEPCEQLLKQLMKQHKKKVPTIGVRILKQCEVTVCLLPINRPSFEQLASMTEKFHCGLNFDGDVINAHTHIRTHM